MPTLNAVATSVEASWAPTRASAEEPGIVIAGSSGGGAATGAGLMTTAEGLGAADDCESTTIHSFRAMFQPSGHVDA